jgi:hypothetical protein
LEDPQLFENVFSKDLAKKRDRYVELHKKLMGEFKSNLIKGEFPCTGYRFEKPLEDGPEEIPPRLWLSLEPDIKNSSATGAGISFDGILVHIQAITKYPVINECREWLKEEIPLYESPPRFEDMLQEALDRFGNRLAKRWFRETWDGDDIVPPSWKKSGPKSPRKKT